MRSSCQQATTVGAAAAGGAAATAKSLQMLHVMLHLVLLLQQLLLIRDQQFKQIAAWWVYGPACRGRAATHQQETHTERVSCCTGISCMSTAAFVCIASSSSHRWLVVQHAVGRRGWSVLPFQFVVPNKTHHPPSSSVNARVEYNQCAVQDRIQFLGKRVLLELLLMGEMLLLLLLLVESEIAASAVAVGVQSMGQCMGGITATWWQLESNRSILTALTAEIGKM